MPKKRTIVLIVIDIACLLAVATASIVLYSIKDRNKRVAGNGTVTITGEIFAEMTAGRQVSGGDLTVLTGTAGNGSAPLTGIDIQALSSFDIGDIFASAGECINIYFVIKNESLTDRLEVTVSLNNSAGNEFDEEHVTTAKYQYTGTDVDGTLLELNWALGSFDAEMPRVQEIDSALMELGGMNAANYLAYHGITPYENCLQIAPDSVQILIIRYNMGKITDAFGLGIALDFAVVAA